MTFNLRLDEKKNLVDSIKGAYQRAIDTKSCTYVMLDITKHTTRTRSSRVCYGQAPQPGYVILATMNYTPCVDAVSAFLYWELIDSDDPQYTEFIGELQACIPVEVW